MTGPEPCVRPLPLSSMAGAIAQSYADKGAIIVSVGEEGTRIGVAGLSWREALDALCQAIHNSIELAHKEGE